MVPSLVYFSDFLLIPWNLEKEVLLKQGDASGFKQNPSFDLWLLKAQNAYKVRSAGQSWHQFQGQEAVSSVEKQGSQNLLHLRNVRLGATSWMGALGERISLYLNKVWEGHMQSNMESILFREQDLEGHTVFTQEVWERASAWLWVVI